MTNCPNGHGALVNNTCQKCGYHFADRKSQAPQAPKEGSAIQKVNGIIRKELMKIKLSGGKVPWHQPWFVVPKQNFTTHHKYQGINRFLLACESDEFYLSEKQLAKYKKATKKEDCPSRWVVFWMPPEYPKPNMTEAERKKLRKFPLMRVYEVYPASGIEGLPERKIEGEKENAVQKDIQKWMSELPVKITYSGNAAYYDKVVNEIRIPKIERFDTSEDFYRAFAHELIHWTGHKDRLNRYQKEKEERYHEDYSREELVAEIGSAYICMRFGIEPTQNTAAYLDQWMSAIEDDPYLLTSAAQQAEKALEYLKLT